MLIPLLLIIGAFVCAGVLAYGVNSSLGQWHHGINIIMAVHRMHWVLVIVALLLCFVLILMVIVGHRRAWWMIGLGPVLALFAHHYWLDSMNRLDVLDNPLFVEASEAKFISDNDYVVGLMLNGDAYAYPYAALYYRPVVVQDLRERRLLLIWSAYANRAVAMLVDRQIKGRDLEIVSMPANALLVYDSKQGQFINGVTGCRGDGKDITGLRGTVDVNKMLWKLWRQLHPETKVLKPVVAGGATTMLQPRLKMPENSSNRKKIALVSASEPLAVESAAITDLPLNLSAGPTHVLLWRNPATGLAEAFDRQAGDLFPTFKAGKSTKHPQAVWMDTESHSFWTGDGRAVEGPMKGEHLKRIGVEDDLYQGVMKFWCPVLRVRAGSS